MSERCQFWKDYDSLAGPVSYCELAAFNRPVNPDFLAKIGCTAEKRKECLGTMELNVGGGAVPVAVPQPDPVPELLTIPPLPCDPPPVIAKSMVGVAIKKAATALPALCMLAILAGAYIALGAVLFTIVTNDLSHYIGDGLTRMVGGIAFSLGLILVILGGAELFTGNNLLVTGLLDKKVTARQVLVNWFWVYLFNFVGALVVASFFYFSGIWKANDCAIAARAINVAYAKATLPWGEALFRGILCNWLVCLAVWLSLAAKDGVSKIFGIMIPIAAFVAAGFEHSIANMYFIPMGLFLKGNGVVQAVFDPALLQLITWKAFFLSNLVPVTIGNLIGGVVFVAFAYWNAYLRPTGLRRRLIANGRI